MLPLLLGDAMTYHRSSPPPEWRRGYVERRTWRDAAVDIGLGLIVLIISWLILTAAWGCGGAEQRAAVSGVGTALNIASEHLTDALADALVRAGEDGEAAVLAQWAPVLAAYEAAAGAQNACADRLEAGQNCSWELVRESYCGARAALAGISPLPDWPLGGCP